VGSSNLDSRSSGRLERESGKLSTEWGCVYVHSVGKMSRNLRCVECLRVGRVRRARVGPLRLGRRRGRAGRGPGEEAA